MKNLIIILLISLINANVVCFGQDIDFKGKAGIDYFGICSKINGKKIFSEDEKRKFAEFYTIPLDSLIIKLSTYSDENKTANANSDLFSPTIIADGVGTFVANRMKEEANIAYLNKFTSYIGDTNLLELQILFPNTKDELLLVKDKIYDYKNYFPTLRNQFVEDFNNLPSSFISVFEDEKTFQQYYWKEKLTPERKSYLAFLFDLGDKFAQGNINTLDFIDNIRNKKYFKNLVETSPEKQLFYLITDFASHLNDNGKITKDIVNSNLKINCFVELLIHSNSNKSEILKILINDNNKRTNLKNILISFNHLFNFADSNFDKQVEGRNRIIQFSKIADNAISIISIKENYITDLHNSIKIVKGIVSKDYGSAISNAVTLLESWKCEKCDDNKGQNKFINKFSKFGTFMANVINAKEGESMLAALNAAALPVRSYQMKRNNTFTWSIGALGGVSQRIPFTLANEKSSFGISAPVGMDFSFGINKADNLLFRKGNNWGISIPIIDVSAVTAIRLLGNKDVLPEITWSNILSPGLFINYGIRRQPITLSLGIQKGAGLVKIEDSKAFIGYRENRFIIGASFDIPMFKLFSNE